MAILRSLSAAASVSALFLTIGVAHADKVLLISSGNSQIDTSTYNLLTAAGQTVILGPTYTSFGSGGPVNLSSYNAVVLQENNSSIGGEIPVAGQTSLVNYVNGGGGLLTTAWLQYYDGAYGGNTTLDPILPAVKTSGYDYDPSIILNQVTANSVVDQGLPSTFTFAADNDGGTESWLQPVSPSDTVFFSSSPDGYDAVIGGSSGSGRIIDLSTLAGTAETGDPNYGKLFVNSVNWVEGQGSGTSTPEPSALLMGGISAVGMGLLRRRRACGRGTRN